VLLLTLSGEIHIKSTQTRRRFQRILLRNLRTGVERRVPGAQAYKVGLSFVGIKAPDEEAAAVMAARTFGVARVDAMRKVPFTTLDDLAAAVADLAGDRVAGRTFAVRIKRSGNHEWTSKDAERVIGAALFERSAGVDLAAPEVMIRLRVLEDEAYLVERTWPGPRGLPLGTQDRLLLLLSGGFDSAVAGWMLMSRGSPIDFVHFKLDCAQGDHALAVGHHLWEQWGHGVAARAHVVDFGEIEDALRLRVDQRLRQVVLKQMMVEAAARIAGESERIDGLLTGASLGQVSSQTLAHLIEIDRMARLPVFRPLLGLSKEEIIDRSRRIGTYDLSARAREVCDLSAGGPVAVAAGADELRAARGEIADAVLDKSVETRTTVDLADWMPGMPLGEGASG
jgi:thiamine biosynthesis protein ThiI